MKKEKKLSTLLEMSKKVGVSKPTLIFYAQLGLIKPVMHIGKMAIFDEGDFMKRWAEIIFLRKKNTLSQIREILSKKDVNKAK